MSDFVHLHVHSDFSLLDAAVSVTALADKAERLGMTHLALTDHGNMFGAMEFIAACDETINKQGQHEKRKNPIKPIIGCEVYVSPFSRLQKTGTESENKYYHLILLAKNREGYLNLVKLCSFAYTEGFYYRPRIDDELLEKYHGGLIALSACVSGEIPRLIQAGKTGDAEKKARRYKELFGEDENGEANFFLEIQDHGIPAEKLRGNLSQRDINKVVIEISKRTGIPLVATNDVHYLDRDDNVAHDTLLCIGTGKVRTEEKRKKYHGDQFYLKSGEEMAALFPDFAEAIANTVRIAARCKTDVPNISVKELTKYLPDFEIPAGFNNADAYIRHLVSEGLAKRYAKEKASGSEKWQEITNRAEYELGVVIQMGFTGYFLIVADFINWARNNNISVGPGRGSGAGSIVAYSLRITDIDPLKYGLLFERFLNPERISMPDFDVDFANEGRDDVIKYVTEKYGQDKVGQIITFGTLGAKAVIKDVARTLGISIPESDMITKLIPRDPKITLQKAIDGEPKLKELAQDSRYTELFTLAGKLEGLNRHSSIHASGVVIGRTALYNFAPLFKDPKTGAVSTQYDMNHLEKCGLVKMDLLGLKTLDVIKHTEELIRDRGGEFAGFSVETVDENDEATFRMLSDGLSFEVFQFESDGMQDTLKRAKPDKIEDLIALNALYRPGPMANIPKYINSKNGSQAITYPDPSLKDALKETYGVIVYQEQVMQVARIIAGYSMGQADLLRRAMGKKKKEIIDKEKIPFLEGAVKQGFSRTRAGEIYDILVPFCDYGFNKSHAAGYSVLAYRTAYLKANFPAEFMAANLTNEIHSANKDKLSECISEARKMGIAVDPPDINRSFKLFTIADGRIVFGLLGIKGLGDAPADEIVSCRKDGPYKDFLDFLNRVDIKAVGKSVIEKLIQTGSFDNLGRRRETLLGNLEQAVEYVQKIKDGKKFGQVSLFMDTGEKEYLDFKFEEFPEISRADKLKTEKELIGFYFSAHPMDEYQAVWKDLVKADLSRPEALVLGNHILVGLVKNVKVITNRKGDRMAFAMLEDYNGEIELTFFPGAWTQCGEKIENDKVAILKGKIEYQQNRDKRSFTVDDCLDLDDIANVEIVNKEDMRQWDRFANIRKHAKDMEINLLDFGRGKAEAGTYIAIGMLKSIRTHVDKKGKEMAFGSLQDPNGEIDVLFFAKTWENCKDKAVVGEILALKGSIEAQRNQNNGQYNVRNTLLVTSIQDVNKLVRDADKKETGKKTTQDSDTKMPCREMHIRLAAGAAENQEMLNFLKNCIEENPGSCPVFIHVPVLALDKESVTDRNSRETIIRAAGLIDAEASVSLGSLERCPAVADVWRAG